MGAELADPDDDMLLISRLGQAIRFPCSDDQLRPMGRPTSGVTGMRFRDDDSLLAMAVVSAGGVPDDDQSDDQAEDDQTDDQGPFVFTVTDGGYAKRSSVASYRVQNRGGLGIKAMKLTDDRGELVGALVVQAGDKVMAIRESGQITRSQVDEVPVKGRDTMGVRFVNVRGKDRVIAIAHDPEPDEPEESTDAEPETAEGAADVDEATTSGETDAGEPDQF